MMDSGQYLFVSHVSEDRAAALDIVKELERRGIGCWIAPRDVRPGRPFDDEIVDAIENSRAILLIFSELCNESEYIRREVTVAGESRKLIIPFRIEDAQPRRGLRVRLSDLHWLDGFVARERAIDELIRELPQIGGQVLPSRRAEPLDATPAAPPQGPAARPAPGARPAHHWAPIAGAVIVAIVAIIAAWFWSTGTTQWSPAAAVSAAEALDKGKAAFEAKDYTAALRWNRQAAEQNNPTAQNSIGYFYEKGLGVPQDYAEAIHWYRQAAEQGHAPAQRNLGNLYEQGSGVERDYGEALRWFRLAADQGNAGAQTNIGYLYERGLGVAQDYTEAMRWYHRAAEQGEATAQNNIGVFYDKGYGVAPDDTEALRWYQLAAGQGNIDAEYNLALFYANGRGGPPNLSQARQLMQKAAAAGDAEAKKWLGDHGG